MKVTGNDILGNTLQVSAADSRMLRAMQQTAAYGENRNSDTAKPKEQDSAYSVRISEQARIRAQQDFERRQQQDAAGFERELQGDRVEFERRQQREKDAFERQEAQKSAEFDRGQQAEATAFKNNNKLQITNYE